MVEKDKLTRRQLLWASLSAAAVAVVQGCLSRATASRRATTRRPNIVLLVTDDQRAESLGCAGNQHIQTPNIDLLAKGGVRFTQSFTTTAICMCSRASILTGMYTRVHGINDFAKPLARNLFEQSYPMLLKKAGYRTGFVGKWGVGLELPVADYDFFKGFAGQGAYFSPPGGKHLTVIETDHALEFLRDCKAQQPFCLAVSFKAPHVQDEGRTVPGIYSKYPYDRALDAQYAAEVIPGIATADQTPVPGLLQGTLNTTREAPDFSPATYQEAMKDLYRLITGVDLAVGRIVDAVKQLGFENDTVYLYTSDHGSFYGEHGFGGKWLMYEESIRTPMILCDPRLPAECRNITCNEMVLNIDVPATVLDLAGIKPPRGMQGKSFLPLARNQQLPWRAEWFYEHHYRNQKPESIAASEGIRTRDWKYIRYIDSSPVCEQLFNLRNDPREENDLASDPLQSDQLNHMRARWEIWGKRLDHHSITQQWIDPA